MTTPSGYHFLHIPQAYRFSKGVVYGMTAAIQPSRWHGKTPLAVTLRVGLSFTSPEDKYAGRVGANKALERARNKDTSFCMVVPILGLCREGYLLKELKKEIDKILPCHIRPEALERKAKTLGVPIRLLCHRYARNEKL